jgi:hypothetical protein
MNDEAALPGRPASINLTASEGSSEERRCVLCPAPATTRRKTVSSLGYWSPATEPVCELCAAELDRLIDRCVRGMVEVDRAVRKFRGRLAA